MSKFHSALASLTLVSALALATAGATAADMYRSDAPVGMKDGPALYLADNWSGFYVGVNGGYGWAGSNQLQDPVFPTVPFNGVSPEGGFGGGQIGYNWQGGLLGRNFVFGLETDLQGSGISDRRFDVNGDTYRSDLNYFGTVRGRLGYSFGTTLLYGTGGFAYGGLQKHDNDNINNGGDFKFNDVATGYVLGGGLEHKISPAWSVKAEYQYINLGKNDPVDVSGNGFGTLGSNTGVLKDDDYHTVRVGLNYHFGQSQGYDSLK